MPPTGLRRRSTTQGPAQRFAYLPTAHNASCNPPPTRRPATATFHTPSLPQNNTKSTTARVLPLSPALGVEDVVVAGAVQQVHTRRRPGRARVRHKVVAGGLQRASATTATARRQAAAVQVHHPHGDLQTRMHEEGCGRQTR